MTAVDVTTRPALTPAPPLGQRMLNVARLLVANPWTPIYTPLIILSTIFVLNYAIWQLIELNTEDGVEENFNNGGVAFVMIYMLVIAVQNVNATFPFAMGFGVTRRDFYLGSSAFFVVLSAGYAALLAVMGQIERATDGWGLQAQFFAPLYIGDLGPLGWFFLYFAMLLFFFFVGAAVAGFYVRWRAYGMYGFFLGLAVLNVGGALVLTATDTWGTVGQFLTDAGVLGTAAWSLILTALISLGGYAILRRATPRN